MPRFAAWPLAVISAGLTVLACEKASSPLDTGRDPQFQPAGLAIQAGDSQFATVGRPVPVNPAVRVVDDSGRQVKGVEVAFAVTSGGGSATGTTAFSDSAGIATVGSWTLGSDLGRQTMTATIVGADSGPVMFTALALCDCWKSKGSLNVGRNEAGSAVIDGKLYVAGGHNYRDMFLPIEEYDPATDTWTARAMLQQGEKMGVAALNGRIYVVGADYGEVEVTPWLQSYDPATDQVTRHAPPPTPRMQLEAVAIDGRFYALGGYSIRNGHVNALEVYNPATDTWSTKAPMPQGRRYPAVAVVNGILYVIGGEAAGEILSSVVAYDPATDRWTTRASMLVPMVSASAGVVDGKIYVAGGGPVGPQYVNASPYVYAYDPARDAWSVQPLLHGARWGATAAALDGVLYVIGGAGRPVLWQTVEALKP